MQRRIWLKSLKKFYQGNNHVAGSGLGLSISEQIVKLHGGHLLIKSQEGLGTTVKIFLPK
ncbi:ATP-binding protein [Paenibacillus sp. RC67]|uniref:ATP-binding protein n=1 Tax=Paenibacillus sp. RC67 TaxID=3039392 RepID=UPI0024ACEAA7|nr:ATP-binding protein [Paenibacillus sp. RC67]